MFLPAAEIMIGVSQNALIRIREELFRKIQKLPLKYHDTHTHGDIMSRFTNDLDAVGEMLNNTMSQIFQVLLPWLALLLLCFYKLDTCNHYHRDGAFDGLRGRHDRKAEQKIFHRSAAGPRCG